MRLRIDVCFGSVRRGRATDGRAYAQFGGRLADAKRLALDGSDNAWSPDKRTDAHRRWECQCNSNFRRTFVHSSRHHGDSSGGWRCRYRRRYRRRG